MIASTGAAITTRPAERTAASGLSAAASHQGWAASATRDSGRRAQITMRRATSFSRAARAIDPPRRPGARMVSWVITDGGGATRLLAESDNVLERLFVE